MIELIGMIGAICFALSGIPQAVKSIIDGHSNGISHGTIWLWLIGEFAMLSYAFGKYSNDLILIINYLANFFVVAVIAFYKYKPKKEKA